MVGQVELLASPVMKSLTTVSDFCFCFHPFNDESPVFYEMSTFFFYYFSSYEKLYTQNKN